MAGADAIFSCLGPALEVFSRYSRVEKPIRDQVSLHEYMEHVWVAISREALSVVLAMLTPQTLKDGRLTAIWLWTLSTAVGNEVRRDTNTETADEDKPNAKAKTSGYILDYDTARKIAQGLGAHLDKLHTVVEVKGDTARLLSVEERGDYLFGKTNEQIIHRKKVKQVQPNLFELTEEFESGDADSGVRHINAPKAGATVLDRVHQSMLLFATGRADAMKRFLLEDGIGHDQRFWILAQALSALYPPASDEKRWVDGVLARKKGLGL